MSNDAGNFIAAGIPFAKLPTPSGGSGNGRVEGGINYQINHYLPAGFVLFIYQLTNHIALDLNGFFDLTRGAPGYNVLGGTAARF